MERAIVVLLMGCALLVGCGSTRGHGEATASPQAAPAGQVRGGVKGGPAVPAAGPAAPAAGPTTVTEDEVGAPFYPGSVETPSTAIHLGSGPQGTVAVVRSTTDSVEKVAEFYRTALPDATLRAGSSELAIVSYEARGHHGQITIAHQNGTTRTNIQILLAGLPGS